MSAFEGKAGRVMIEKRRLPHIRVVARLALVLSIAELIGMRIFVTITATCRSFREVYMAHRQLKIWRLVAIGAGYCAMRSRQRKRRCVMIKLREVLPLLRRVASPAAGHLSG